MTDALLAIDRALDGLCPCGADPAPGSAYCGDDCTPTHIAGDTDTSDAGWYGAQSTPMRWRPDLVSEHDDSRLALMSQFRRGPYNATVYEISGSDGVHCRLDDENRFVGLDADGYQFASPEGLEPVWQRLERELGNSRHLEPDDTPPPFGLGAGPASWDTVLPAWMVTDLRESFTRVLERATLSIHSSRGGLWRPRPDPAAMTEAVLADHDCAAWPRLPNRTPLARYLLITQRLCYNCSRHGVPGPAAGALTRHRCPHCAVTYPGTDIKVHIGADFQRDRYTIRVTSGTGTCNRIITGEEAENRQAAQRCYDDAERAVLTELGLIPSRSQTVT